MGNSFLPLNVCDESGQVNEMMSPSLKGLFVQVTVCNKQTDRNLHLTSCLAPLMGALDALGHASASGCLDN